MDFLTHTLVGVGAARLLSPDRRVMPQLALAGALGSLLQDADSWLYFLGPTHYGQYHRVVSHTVWGLCVVALMSAGGAWLLTRPRRWRTSGWLLVERELAETTNPNTAVPHVAFRWLVLAASLAAALHWMGDWITGFGNLQPFWPWSSWDPSLHAVHSFDWAIFGVTLAWHVCVRSRRWARKTELLIGAAYLALVSAYVLGRVWFGSSTVW